MGRVVITCRESAPISSSIDGDRQAAGTEADAESRSELIQPSREHRRGAKNAPCENDGRERRSKREASLLCLGRGSFISRAKGRRPRAEEEG